MRGNYKLTKSRFIRGLQCVKALYLDVYSPSQAIYSPETIEKFRKGRLFESKVKALYPDGIDISSILQRNMSRYPSLTADMIGQTGEITLYEAGFQYNDVLVLADVVHKDANGSTEIVEIKNSLSPKAVHSDDIAVQYYTIAHCVSDIKHFFLAYNDGKDNPVFIDYLEEAKQKASFVDAKVKEFKDVLQGFEPVVEMGDQCHNPYDCPYMEYCSHRTSNSSMLSQMD